MKRLLLTITYCIALLLPTQFIAAFSWSTALTNVTTPLTNWYNSYRSQSTAYQLLVPAAAIATLGGGLYYTYFSQTQPTEQPIQVIEPIQYQKVPPAAKPGSLQQLALKNIAIQIQQNPNEALDLGEHILQLLAKEYFLSVDRKLPEWLNSYFEGVSIADLLQRNLTQAFYVNTRSLVLNHHNINSLEGIENLPNIDQVTNIYLFNNKLVSLPDNFNLPLLVLFSLDHNRLQVLPDDFNPQNLQAFYINNNQLQALPNDFNPQNLHLLFLANNRLQTLPNNFNPPRLTHLDLSNNRLQALPANFNPQNLRFLYLINNQLQALPANFNPPRLQYLDIRGNPMSEETIAQLRERMPDVRIYADY